MARFKPYFEVEISKKYSPDERRAIAQEIIDAIVTRTEGGLDKNNEKFAKYSKEYAKEKGQTNVDLTFSGDMLASIELLQNSSGKLRIGYPRDYEGMGKLEGNILSTYGQSKPVTKPRDFLGITDSDLRSILSNYSTKEDAVIAKETTRAAEIIARSSNVENFDDEGE